MFLDIEGECVDYASRVEPYEAMVFSATMLNPHQNADRGRQAGLGSGLPIQWILEAERMDCPGAARDR